MGPTRRAGDYALDGTCALGGNYALNHEYALTLVEAAGGTVTADLSRQIGVMVVETSNALFADALRASSLVEEVGADLAWKAFLSYDEAAAAATFVSDPCENPCAACRPARHLEGVGRVGTALRRVLGVGRPPTSRRSPPTWTPAHSCSSVLSCVSAADSQHIRETHETHETGSVRAKTEGTRGVTHAGLPVHVKQGVRVEAPSRS